MDILKIKNEEDSKKTEDELIDTIIENIGGFIRENKLLQNQEEVHLVSSSSSSSSFFKTFKTFKNVMFVSTFILITICDLIISKKINFTAGAKYLHYIKITFSFLFGYRYIKKFFYYYYSNKNPKQNFLEYVKKNK
jgi:hypothetical protein